MCFLSQALNHHRLFCSKWTERGGGKNLLPAQVHSALLISIFKKLSFPFRREVGRGSQVFWADVTTRPSGTDIFNMAARRAHLKSSMHDQEHVTSAQCPPGRAGQTEATYIQASLELSPLPPSLSLGSFPCSSSFHPTELHALRDCTF